MNEEENLPNWENWTTEELFNHLVDLYQIPYEEEFEDWIRLKAQMIQMCKDSYEHQNKKE